MEAVKKKRRVIPGYLIYELRYGKPIYYKDYDKVLRGELSPEDIMGSSFLQASLVALIVAYLHSVVDKKKYIVATNELGYRFAPKSRYSLDIAIVEREKVKEPSDSYLQVPPKVVIEVDTKADLRRFPSAEDYYFMKTKDLLQACVERVLWIFTRERLVLVAQKGERWFITDWRDTVEVMEGVPLNLEKLLQET